MYANEPVEVRHHIENAENGTRFMRSTGRPHHLPAEVPVAIEEGARLRRPREPGRASGASDLGR
jgi:hypothetical protein